MIKKIRSSWLFNKNERRWKFRPLVQAFAELGAAFHGLKWNNDYTSRGDWAALGFLFTLGILFCATIFLGLAGYGLYLLLT